MRVLALKKAEESNEIVVRMVELDGKPQPEVRVSFAAPLVAAREINGQEQPLRPAVVTAGALVTSFSAYQPRTFAVKLASSTDHATSVRSAPVSLDYQVAVASSDGAPATSGFDGRGNALPAEMLPEEILFNGVRFRLPPAKTGVPNAVVAKAQILKLPSGDFNRVYFLAGSFDGDQKAAFAVGDAKTEITVQDWGGFIGQWDDRQWSSKDTSEDNYGDMIGLTPGYIKRADLAWYSSHHHDAAGKNVAYGYSYLFVYSMDVPAGATTITLPMNDKIRILAISVADENPEVKPVQPLYDMLPAH